ncbi:unnamed protein product (macronuclear) [Paramecium tetraurelia]|uniref:Uncharacterized protein n=1 Tax=Paramecium tetraurelia TaxID=5888 RepID=A0BID8_PARTE|nr:uncharacterized protein GSPATT00004677001 [Paramecium tetraurelia]CAK58305.1 unnamed protein product [Paramecium tetraurelia]|eukprot:XP_001425703.1 hypothetical protein (macronuclear) [Paramecium tetraurelia strain d4-2]
MQKSQLIRVLSDSNKSPNPFSMFRQLSQETPTNQGNSQSMTTDREIARLTRLVGSLKKENESLQIQIKHLEQMDYKGIIQTLEQKNKQLESQVETFKKLPIEKIETLIDDNERLTSIVETQSTKIKSLLTQIDDLKDSSFQNEGKNEIIISMIQELENQKLYVQDEHKKYQILNKEKQTLYIELQMAKQQIKELNQTIEKIKMINLESSEPSDLLHQDYLKSNETVQTFLKNQY